MFWKVMASLIPLKGDSPERRRYINTPKLHKSAGAPEDYPSIISGAI